MRVAAPVDRPLERFPSGSTGGVFSITVDKDEVFVSKSSQRHCDRCLMSQACFLRQNAQSGNSDGLPIWNRYIICNQ